MNPDLLERLHDDFFNGAKLLFKIDPRGMSREMRERHSMLATMRYRYCEV
jgi:hypothetical protein